MLVPKAGSIPRIGGHLALDFANTAGWHASEHRKEWLTGYREVIAWARQAAALSQGAAKALLKQADRHPGLAEAAHVQILDWREGVYRIFTCVAHGRSPVEDDLDLLHRARQSALATSELRWQSGTGGTLHWPKDGKDLLLPAYPAVLAAADLLSAGDFGRLRQCGNHPCGWLFLDTSRSGTRRWCSAAECGNAARVRRFRERHSEE